MLAAVKDILKLLLAPGMFAAMFGISIFAAAKRAEWGIFLLAVFASLPTLWYPLHQFPFGKDSIDIILLGTFIGIYLNKGGFERTPGGFLIGSFLVVSYLALWNSSLRFGLPLPFTTSNPVLGDWKNYFEMVLLYWLVYNAVRTEEQQKTLIVIIGLVVFLISFREFRNFSAGGGFDYDKRAQGPFWIVGLGANHLGAFIAHFAGMLLGFLLVDKHRWRRWLYTAACLFSLHPLFFAYSRGGYLAAVAVITVYGVLRKRALLLVVLGLALSWQTVLPESVVDRITMTETAEGELESSAAERVLLWEHAKQLFSDNMIFGIGYNGFELSRRGMELRDTHNYYMKIACEQGIIGLLFLGLVFFRALRSGWRLFRIGTTDFHRAMGLGFFGCVVAMLITNIFGDRFSYFALSAFFWLVFGSVERAITLSLAARTSASSAAAIAANASKAPA